LSQKEGKILRATQYAALFEKITKGSCLPPSDLHIQQRKREIKGVGAFPLIT